MQYSKRCEVVGILGLTVCPREMITLHLASRGEGNMYDDVFLGQCTFMNVVF